MSTLDPQTLRGRNCLPVGSCIALLLALAVLPYLRTITQGYFVTDDFGLIQLYSEKSAKDLLPLFAGDYSMGIYGLELREMRPLAGLSYMTDYALWGANASGFHASNVVWHALSVVLLFFIAYLLTDRDRMTALLSAALFAAVPVHAEAVSYIAGREDVLSGFFWLAAVLSLICFLRSDSTWAYVSSLLFFTAGLFSKETVLVLPALLAACVLFYRSRRPTARVGTGPLLAPFLLILAFYLLLRHLAFGNPIDSDVADLPAFVTRLPSRLGLLLVPMARDLWAQNLGALGLLASAASGVLLVFFGVSVYRDRRALGSARPMVLLGCAWCCIALLPLVARGGGTERNLYIPSAGFCLAVAPLLVALCRYRTGAWRAVASLCIMLFLLINAGVLISKNETWVKAGFVSRKLHLDFSHLAASIPKGSFVVFLNVPPGTGETPWFTEWALPFALQEPFSSVYRDLVVLETPEGYCCPVENWWEYRKASFQDLLSRSSPVYVALWDAGEGRLRTTPVKQEVMACLREQMRGMRFTRSMALSLVPSLIAAPPRCPAGSARTPPVR